jgi:diphosphomevalonate decarboxylase
MNFPKELTGRRPEPFETTWRSPSNIAFVKYWGKKGHQLPANPSLSMTLKECVTQTKVSFTPSDELRVELFLDGVREEKFAAKIHKYLESLRELPDLTKISYSIQTQNSFPHGTGIASSASGFSAFALCLTEYLGVPEKDFFRTASYLSRLASGSACRSIYGGFTTWGDASDEFATKIEVHPAFENLRDSVLIISSEEKVVSSSHGHSRMSDHPFAQARYSQAKSNFHTLLAAMKTGDLDEIGSILESEALSLHAMMMTSPQAFTLLRPNTLAAIEMVRAFRRETFLPLYFTLDAGPNLHLIYPEIHEHKIRTFISVELSKFAQKVIDDECGGGPLKC